MSIPKSWKSDSMFFHSTVSTKDVVGTGDVTLVSVWSHDVKQKRFPTYEVKGCVVSVVLMASQTNLRISPTWQKPRVGFQRHVFGPQITFQTFFPTLMFVAFSIFYYLQERRAFNEEIIVDRAQALSISGS